MRDTETKPRRMGLKMKILLKMTILLILLKTKIMKLKLNNIQLKIIKI